MALTPAIHIGKEIEARINQLHITATEFARRINTSKQNVNRILKKESIDTATLQRYCEALDFNFFTLYCPSPAENYKVQPTEPRTQLNEAGASGNNNAPELTHLQLELKQADARIAEKDARIADLKELISRILSRQ